MTQVIELQEQSTFSRLVPKPWGHEVVFTPPGLPYAGKLLNVIGGRRLSLQLHDRKTETLTLLSGRASLALENLDGVMVEFDMQPAIGYTVLPGRRHRLSAVADSVVLEASTPEVGVTVRLDDDYRRPDEHLS